MVNAPGAMTAPDEGQGVMQDAVSPDPSGRYVVRTYQNPVNLQLGLYKWRQLGRYTTLVTTDQEIIDAAKNTPLVGCAPLSAAVFFKEIGADATLELLDKRHKDDVLVWFVDLGCKKYPGFTDQNPNKAVMIDTIMKQIFGTEEYNDAKQNALRKKLGNSKKGGRGSRSAGDLDARSGNVLFE